MLYPPMSELLNHIDSRYLLHRYGARILMGIGGIQPVDIRKQDQQIRPDGLRDLGCQGIVIPDHDLIRSYGIVFVDDGEHSQLQQPVQGIDEVLTPGFMDHIVVGDQQLRHRMSVFPEQLVVNVHQLALPHCGGSLLAGDILRALPQPQLSHAHADSAR